MLERDSLARAAMVSRYVASEQRLTSELLVSQYLRDTGRDGAAKRCDDNIAKMRILCQKYKDEIPEKA